MDDPSPRQWPGGFAADDNESASGAREAAAAYYGGMVELRTPRARSKPFRPRRTSGLLGPLAWIGIWLVFVGMGVVAAYFMVSGVRQRVDFVLGSPEERAGEDGLEVPDTHLVVDKPDGWTGGTMEEVVTELGVEMDVQQLRETAMVPVFRRGLGVVIVQSASMAPEDSAVVRKYEHDLGPATEYAGTLTSNAEVRYTATFIETESDGVLVQLISPGEPTSDHVAGYKAVVASLRPS